MVTKIDSLQNLFHALLCDIYFVENKLIVDALPGMASKADSKELKEAIKAHLQQTKAQVERLEKCFKILGLQPQRFDWIDNLNGLFEKSAELVKGHTSSPILDAAMIVIAQRVEHYEIATYGALIEFADTLEYDEVKSILKETIKEEAKTDALLSKLASGGVFKKGINVHAVSH